MDQQSAPKKTPWYVRWYGNPAPVAAPSDEQRFRALYPDTVWNGMTVAEQARARATWQGQQQMIDATRESGSRTRGLLLVIFVVIPLVALLVWVLIAATMSIAGHA